MNFDDGNKELRRLAGEARHLHKNLSITPDQADAMADELLSVKGEIERIIAERDAALLKLDYSDKKREAQAAELTRCDNEISRLQSRLETSLNMLRRACGAFAGMEGTLGPVAGKWLEDAADFLSDRAVEKREPQTTVVTAPAAARS